MEPEPGINDIPVEKAARGNSPMGPTRAPEVYPRLGPERTARGDFSSIGPGSRFFVPRVLARLLRFYTLSPGPRVFCKSSCRSLL